MRLDMKIAFMFSVALFGLAAGAMAADVPSRTIAPAAPVFTWTGFYAGVNAGYGFLDRNNNECFGGCGFDSSSLAVPTLTADLTLGPLAPVVPTTGFPVGFGGF